jgi:hypothetical protein
MPAKYVDSSEFWQQTTYRYFAGITAGSALRL